MPEPVAGSNTFDFLWWSEAVALWVAVGCPREAAESTFVVGARTRNIECRCIEVIPALHPLAPRPHMGGFWDTRIPGVTLSINSEASEVHRSVAAGVVECISFSDWWDGSIDGRRVESPPRGTPAWDQWSKDHEAKLEQLHQKYEALKSEIHAAHRAGQLPPSSCIVRGLQLRRSHVERLLRKLGRLPAIAEPVAAPADVAELVNPPASKEPPKGPKKWLPNARDQHRQRKNERSTAYARRMIEIMQAAFDAGEVTEVYSLKTMVNRLGELAKAEWKAAKAARSASSGESSRHAPRVAPIRPQNRPGTPRNSRDR
jgi:hypothetical protein